MIEKEKTENKNGFVLGIISIVLGLLSIGFWGILWGVAGIVLSLLSIKKAGFKRKTAIIGFIVSITGIIISVVFLIKALL